MSEFTKLEEAALRSIFSETPELETILVRQLETASVTKRENTGGGFFTTISTPSVAPKVNSERVLGYETSARVVGLEHGLGFVLFMESGALSLLEGFAWGPEDTAALDLANAEFEIIKQPMTRVS